MLRKLEQHWRGLKRRVDEAVPISWNTSLELAKGDPECWQPLLEGGSPDWDGALPSGPLPDAIGRYLPGRREPLGLVHLAEAWVYGEDGWVFTSKGVRLLDLSGFHSLHKVAPRVRLPLFGRGARRLTGRTLSLLSPYSVKNYFHHVMDSLSRLYLLEAAGLKLHDFDQILIPHFETPSTRRWWGLLGLEHPKLIPVRVSETPLFHCEQLVCPSFPAMRRTCSFSAVSYLRRVNGARSLAPGKRRIFVQRRSHARHMVNEAEVIAYLSTLGFEVVNPSRVPDVEALFAEASFIVGDHGAALTNMLWSPTGTKLLELLPTDQSYPHYFTMARHCGHIYDALLCPSLQVRERPRDLPYHSNFNFEVPLALLKERVQGLLASR